MEKGAEKASPRDRTEAIAEAGRFWFVFPPHYQPVD